MRIFTYIHIEIEREREIDTHIYIYIYIQDPPELSKTYQMEPNMHRRAHAPTRRYPSQDP